MERNSADLTACSFKHNTLDSKLHTRIKHSILGVTNLGT